MRSLENVFRCGLRLLTKFTTILLAAGAITVVAQGQGLRQSLQAGEAQRRVDAAAEEAESSNPKERELRMAKNRRYDGGGLDLTVELPKDSAIFFEHIWPAVEFIPADESAVVVVGRVIKVQPYLSSDRSRIYTEITIAVDDFLKPNEDNRIAANKIVVIDRPGGVLELKTGHIVRDDIQIDYLGKLRLDKRYVVFAQATNDGNDFSLIKSYELVDGKVFTNNTRRSRLISTLTSVPSTWENEAVFVKAVREAIVSTARNSTRRRG